MFDILERAALEAGEILKKYYKTGLTAKTKTSFKDLVTQADFESQQKIYDVILSLISRKGLKTSDVGFIGEENLNQQGDHLFIIDPLDGIASGYDYFCVTIGYYHRDKMRSGIIYNPITETIYMAEHQKGAYKLHKKSQTKLTIPSRSLDQILCAIVYHADKNIYSKEMKMTNRIIPHVRGIRVNHSAAMDLALCADSVFGIATAAVSSIWDIAAGKLIVEESNGIVFDLSGKPFSLDIHDPKRLYPYLAGHPKLTSMIVEMTKGI